MESIVMNTPGGHQRLAVLLGIRYGCRDQSRPLLPATPEGSRLLERIDRLVTSHFGRRVALQRLDYLALFPLSLDAVRAALELLGEIGEAAPGCGLQIAIHLGDVALDDGEVDPAAADLVSAVTSFAQPRSLLITQAVYEQIWDKPGLEIVPLGNRLPPGVGHRIFLYAVMQRRERKLTSRLVRISRRHPLLTALPLLAATLAGAYLYRHLNTPRSPEAYYIALQPFVDLSASRQDTFSEGFSEVIATQLSSLPNVYVVPAGEGVAAPLRLEGGLSAEEGSIRVQYRLVRTTDGKVLDAAVLDGLRDEIFQLQDRVARAVVKVLETELGMEENALEKSARPTDSIPAYDYYLQGITYLRQNLSRQAALAAARLFEQATREDPRFADAWAGLCMARWQLYDNVQQEQYVTLARQACREALRLDPKLALAHTALGMLEWGTGRLEEAKRSFLRALELDPKDAYNLRSLGRLLESQGAFEEAEETFRKAIKLAPGMWSTYMAYGAFLFNRGRYEEAIDAFNTVLSLTPDNSWALTNLSAAYLHNGNFENASLALQRAQRIEKNYGGYVNAGAVYYYLGRYKEAAAMYREAIRLVPADHRTWGSLAEALIRLPGEEAAARRALEQAILQARKRLQVVAEESETLAGIAWYAACLDRRKEALDALRQALSGGSTGMYVHYFAARTWRRLGFPKEAQIALDQALRLGFPPALAKADPELEGLRSSIEGIILTGTQ